MKKSVVAYAVFVSFAFSFGCADKATDTNRPSKSRWTLHTDSMNLAVLISDYQSYNFEKGALNYYPPCNSCDLDSLPFIVLYHPPSDFGDITFTYTETGDTLFRGTIIWMGSGELKYPEVFSDAGKFKTLSGPPPAPFSVEYFNIIPAFVDTTFEAKADTAWSRIEKLDIVAEFAKEAYRVGIYLYAPRVGLFDPAAAKWIVFLYRGKLP